MGIAWDELGDRVGQDVWHENLLGEYGRVYIIMQRVKSACGFLHGRAPENTSLTATDQ